MGNRSFCGSAQQVTQSSHRPIDLIERSLEYLIRLPEWISDLPFRVAGGVEVTQEGDPIRLDTEIPNQVVAVPAGHDEEKIEGGRVARPDQARAMAAQVQASLSRQGQTPWLGGPVGADEAGRYDFDPGDPLLFQCRAKGGLGKRASANIARANHEDPIGFPVLEQTGTGPGAFAGMSGPTEAGAEPVENPAPPFDPWFVGQWARLPQRWSQLPSMTMAQIPGPSPRLPFRNSLTCSVTAAGFSSPSALSRRGER